jgi:hypothetical protein
LRRSAEVSALAVDVKTAQTRVDHRRATTTPDVYAQPTASAGRGAVEMLGDHFLGTDPSVKGSTRGSKNSTSRAVDARWDSSKGIIVRRRKDQEVASDVDEDGGGASWNRTSDLSIISAAL